MYNQRCHWTSTQPASFNPQSISQREQRGTPPSEVSSSGSNCSPACRYGIGEERLLRLHCLDGQSRRPGLTNPSFSLSRRQVRPRTSPRQLMMTATVHAWLLSASHDADASLKTWTRGPVSQSGLQLWAWRHFSPDKLREIFLSNEKLPETSFTTEVPSFRQQFNR